MSLLESLLDLDFAGLLVLGEGELLSSAECPTRAAAVGEEL